jgi:stage V sporulation protein G
MCEITEVSIKTIENPCDALRAFCTIVLDNEIAIKDIKMCSGKNGLFVAMPNKKVMGRCSRCNTKNALKSNFCNQCGCKLNFQDDCYVDIVHPITQDFRNYLNQEINAEYQFVLRQGT